LQIFDFRFQIEYRGQLYMKVYINPAKSTWEEITERPAMDTAAVMEKVKPILQQVRGRGDVALRELTLQFDGSAPENFLVSPAEIAGAAGEVSAELKSAIQQAAANIELFHQKQLVSEEPVTTMPGITCWRRWVGIEKVGLYIPGGTAPLFSTLLMLAIPARIAGCKQIVLCTPPAKDGTIHPAILYAAGVAGVTAIFKVGGAQAIAAMAYGTESIPKVYKIFGPGNQYVTAAKQLVQLDGLAIDMPAGPSEVCVWADESANPAWVAADLLSQAEHGSDSQVLLVANKKEIIDEVQEQLVLQLEQLPRKQMAAASLQNSRAVVMTNEDEALQLVNAYAAEHLIISREDALLMAERVSNAGSIFIGNYSPESVGDYASGTNHTLPTNGYARAYSGVSIDSFVKKITVQQLSAEGLRNIASTVTEMAVAEGLQAHARAVTIRLENN
jgi:histidinol dehydrogenase